LKEKKPKYSEALGFNPPKEEGGGDNFVLESVK
jgi:hypothetical protein